MEMDEFVELVASMRDSQRQYFQLRTGEWLERAKALEKHVDKAIAEIREAKSGVQLKLF